MASAKGVGIPIKLMHEAEGHVLTVELKTGQTYRGELHDAEDNWNCQLKNVTFTERDGRISHLDHVFLRGSRIRFMIIPDMLKNAPMFKRIDPKHKTPYATIYILREQAKNVATGVGGRGRAVAARAKAKAAAGAAGGPGPGRGRGM